MTQITIPAQVVNGHLQHEQCLAEFEGMHVLVALTVVPMDANVAEEMPPDPEFVWKAPDEFSSETDSDPH